MQTCPYSAQCSPRTHSRCLCAGRLPIRVSLSPLRADDFRRILTATEFSLLKQTKALMAAEGVDLQFTDCGVTAIAEAAEEMNRIVDNIGARRLRTVLARLTEDISFKAHRLSGTTQVRSCTRCTNLAQR